jgi:hypothetical protein
MSRHRPLRIAVLAGVALACLVGSGVALAGPGGWSPWVKVPSDAIDLDASMCGFAIHVGTVLDQQYSRNMKLANGTEIVQNKGLFVESLTNTDTNKTIIQYELGPQTTTTYPDGSIRGESWGHHGFFFYPPDQQSVNEPGVAYVTGHVVVTIAPGNGVVTSFTFTGRQTNICKLLK